MFFLQKEGVYGHGVYWIGQSVAVGIAKADKAAKADRDNYHEWVVYKYQRVLTDGDYMGIDNVRHEVMYTTRKIMPVQLRGLEE